MEQNYTARLENWSHNKEQNVIAGDIYNDANGRWKDGTRIVTSQLLPMSMQISTPKEGRIIGTRNSTYLLGSKK